MDRQQVTPEVAKEIEFLESVKTVDDLNAGLTTREATQRKCAYISRFGYDAWVRLCQCSSKSYGIRQ